MNGQRKSFYALLAVLSAFVIVLCAQKTLAFWSASVFQIHQLITTTALTDSKAFVFQGQAYVFQDKAVTAINKWHKVLDAPGLYDPRDHFDKELLADGFLQLKNSRAAIEVLLSGSPDQTVLWTELGPMLHQIQDYYSHSTYLASGHSTIQDFGLLTDPDSGASIPQWFLNSVYTTANKECTTDPNTLNSSIASLTTGYYQANPPPTGKCNHGRFGMPFGIPVQTIVAGLNCSRIGTKQSDEGIARDSPCSSIKKEVDEFLLAEGAAITDTKFFVKSITDKLDKSGNAAGFCALLGLASSVPICASTTGGGTGGGGGGTGGGTGGGSSALPTGSITASTLSVVTGDSTTISWTSQNASSCFWDGGGISGSGTSGSGVSTGPLTTTTTYTIRCTDSTGNLSIPNTTTVTVSPAPAPTVSMTANPPSVSSGGSSTLMWTSQYAASCTASGGWSGLKGVSGPETVGPLTASTSFTITCSNSNGVHSTPVTVPVTVTSLSPTVTLIASPTTVSSGGSAILTWSSTNATSCTAIGGWTASTATSDSISTGPLTATTTYSMTCSNASGMASTPATAIVSIGPPAPTITFTATPGIVNSGGFSTLTWSATNATSCSATGGWSSSTSTSGSQVVGPLTATALYELICVGAGGPSNFTVGVTVAPVVLAISPASPTVSVGSSTTLTVAAHQNGNPIATPAGLVWTTSNPTLATVTNGTVTGIAAGAPQITVTDPVSGATTSVSVTVRAIGPSLCVPPAGATTCAITLYSIPDLITHSGFGAPVPTTVTTTDTQTGTVSTQSIPLGVTIYDNVNGPPLTAPACNPNVSGCPPLTYHQFNLCQVDGKWTPASYSSVVLTQIPLASSCTGSDRSFNISTSYSLIANGTLSGTQSQIGKIAVSCVTLLVDGTPDTRTTTGQDIMVNSITFNLKDGSGNASVAGNTNYVSTNSVPPSTTTVGSTTQGQESWPSEAAGAPPVFTNTGITAAPPVSYAAGAALPPACVP